MLSIETLRERVVRGWAEQGWPARHLQVILVPVPRDLSDVLDRGLAVHHPHLEAKSAIRIDVGSRLASNRARCEGARQESDRGLVLVRTTCLHRRLHSSEATLCSITVGPPGLEFVPTSRQGNRDPLERKGLQAHHDLVHCGHALLLP